MALPTLGVLDKDEAPQTINTPNSGRQAAADSQAVVLSTEDKAAIGASIDAEATGDGGIISLLKRIRTLLGTTFGASFPSYGIAIGASDGTSMIALPGHATDGLTVKVSGGPAAHDAAVSGNPLLIGALASAAAPTAVSTDGDAVRLWSLLNGALAVNVTAGGALIPGDATFGLKVDVSRSALSTGAATAALQVTHGRPATAGNLSLTTHTTGTNYTAFASQVCGEISIVNKSAFDLQVRRGGAGAALDHLAGTERTYVGITNASDLDVRRADLSNTPLTLTAEWRAWA